MVTGAGWADEVAAATRKAGQGGAKWPCLEHDSYRLRR
jgi:hypothetical protein